MQIDQTKIREGMTAYSSEGEKLGKVRTCDASMFVIEKGFFFPKDYIARYDDVRSVDGDAIHLALPKDSFHEGGTRPERSSTQSTGEDVRVPIAEEELDVVKRDRPAGEVRLKKDVVTETKHVDVPVTREAVRVERAPASDRTPAADEKLFQEERASMPIHEEEIEVRKRPVVKEEARLRKERFTEQRAAEADVRKEQVDIEGDEGTDRIRRDEDRPGASRLGEPDER